jgi:hypothetical protein
MPLQAAVEPLAPDAIPGLVAWYRIDDLHELKDKEPVRLWPDASGHGHDLVAPDKGPVAWLAAQRLGSKPVVQIQKGVTFKVTNPFDLSDHTIFLVYRSQLTQRALLRSDLDPDRGIVLIEGSRYHVYRVAEVGHRPFPYTTPIGVQKSYGITVLGRDDWKNRAFVDGVDVSSWIESRQIMRVGAFFNLTYSKQVVHDGGGLDIAEIAIYDRFLGGDERSGLTRHLAEKYGLEVRDAGDVPLRERLADVAAAAGLHVAWLEGPAGGDVGSPEGAAIAWTAGDRTDPPFKRDPQNPTRVICTEQGIAAQIHLVLGLRAAQPGADLRVMLLKNNAEYLPDEASTGPFGGEGAAGLATVELDTNALLEAGDFLEVLVFGKGAAVPVSVDPAESVFVVSAP